jgi:hypothetical protein
VARDPIEDASFRVIGEDGPAEILRRSLLESLQEDALFQRLKEAGRAGEVLEVVSKLEPGKHYGTPALPGLIGDETLKESTVRTWVDRFSAYVQPIKEGRNYKFPADAVVRVRILHILLRRLFWNFSSIENALSGLVEEHGQGERTDTAIKALDVDTVIDQIVPMRGGDYRAALTHLITQLVDVQASAEAGHLVLSQDALPASVRQSAERVAQLEQENQRLLKALTEANKGLEAMQTASTDLQGRLKLAEGQISAHAQAWASVPPDEIRAVLERQKKGFWARVFGR